MPERPRFVAALGRRARSRLAIALAVLCFLAVSAFALQALERARLDLTADSRHTLSDATRDVLADIPEPITLAYYRSEAVRQAGAPLSDYARRVSAMLDHYVRLSDGMLRLQRLTPEPYSPEEDRALADGLTAAGAERMVFREGGIHSYLGTRDLREALDRAAVPLRSFMLEQTRPGDIDLFLGIAGMGEQHGGDVADTASGLRHGIREQLTIPGVAAVNARHLLTVHDQTEIRIRGLDVEHAGADLEKLVAGADLEDLGLVGDREGLRNGLAQTDGKRLITVSTRPKGGFYEEMASHSADRGQYAFVGDAFGA